LVHKPIYWHSGEVLICSFFFCVTSKEFLGTWLMLIKSIMTQSWTNWENKSLCWWQFFIFEYKYSSELVMGPGLNIFDQGWVRSIFCYSGWVRSAIFGLSLGLKISPKNPNFFCLCQKKSHWVGSKSIRVKNGSASF